MRFACLVPLIVPLIVAQSVASESGAFVRSVTETTPSVAHLKVEFLARAARVVASRKQGPSTFKPAKGVFLIANEFLSDPNFSQTVVLMLEYDKNGAIGLVINRPTEVSLASLLPEVEGLKGRNELVFIGGPVGGSQLFLLVRSTNRPSQSEEIVDGVYASASIQTLREIIAEDSDVAAFQAYAGYAGWGPGQLDAELSRGDWLVASADSEILFDTASDAIWPKLIRKNKGLWVSPDPRVPPPRQLSLRGKSPVAIRRPLYPIADSSFESASSPGFKFEYKRNAVLNLPPSIRFP